MTVFMVALTAVSVAAACLAFPPRDTRSALLTATLALVLVNLFARASGTGGR